MPHLRKASDVVLFGSAGTLKAIRTRAAGLSHPDFCQHGWFALEGGRVREAGREPIPLPGSF
jgi:hypothetical protein